MTDLCIMSSMKSKTETTWRCIRRVADSYHAILKTINDDVSTLAKPHNHPSEFLRGVSLNIRGGQPHV